MHEKVINEIIEIYLEVGDLEVNDQYNY